MDLLIIVSSANAGPLLTPLARACERAGCSWGAFFTHEGVKLAGEHAVGEALESASSAIACHDSWNRFMNAAHQPAGAVQFGSQTNNSEMAGQAARIVSL